MFEPVDGIRSRPGQAAADFRTMLNRNAPRDATIVDVIENHVPRISAADSVLTRAEWQRPLFTGLNRAALLDCVPAWDLRSISLRVHRNHAFEPVATATRAYAAWNGLSFDWHLGAY